MEPEKSTTTEANVTGVADGENKGSEKPATAPSTPQPETPQQEFDRLAARKSDLDRQLTGKPLGIRELTPEQNEINQIDARLMELWTTQSGLVRKEDK